ncbi:BREX system P-loop protein BrxC [Psychromicrobium xiongbiense]|uniref:BREX system P-loop protein BrxC n=1 Tax=Psychromicrobium xiongbiense TaxID=3051184 RepID=UPI00255601B0|nr:BREX system P-loop protein BrxC [Psychromicrobium sp. YIM S02556]
MSTINEIFAKPIDRSIEGVIKADDNSQLATEVEEYVLTNEAAKGLEHVLEAYTNHTTANGVWISGFFGSGKSHLLKMLAHLLGDIEGHDYPRPQVSEQFRAKASGAFLPALIQKADGIAARSLLFNIDQKASLISKDQNDALLKVFVKVFNESRGYFGNQGHIARFERDLDARGQYAAFKDTYERLAGISWSQGREQSTLEAGNIDKAFAEVNGTESPGIIRQYGANYSVSIEDFAEEVATWLRRQPEGYRLNFFVDEVGQFIGTNTQLMLNLQTIAESLATKCQGSAWIFVTSQEDMEKVGGDRTKQQGNDFSKIQARFRNHLKLTSQDVEEVIRKRLLAKTAIAATEVAAIYDAEHANFKTLFDFIEGRHYPSYRDKSHFVGTYPFVSYQFPLFQSAIEGISDHNIFEGRNSSVGERSMLGVVQQVASQVAGESLGTLASFDQMFEGIRAALKSANQRAINDAENAARNGKLSALAVRLLKALFLVKYVDTFKASARNLTVLVYDRFGTDLIQLGKDVNAALNALEAQTYIQRNGDLYDYLTNEEQKIEQEIKNVDIDSADVAKRLNELLAGSVVKTTKIAYKNGQIFPFGYKLDGTPYGKQHELSLHFTSPDTEFSVEQIKAHSAGLDELRVVLPEDTSRTLTDLRLLLKTESYVKRAQSSSRTEIEQKILVAKATQNATRESRIIERLRTAVGASTLIHNASVLDVNSSDAQTRVSDGFQRVIAATYTNLGMLGGKAFTEQGLGGLVNPVEDALFEQSVLDVPGSDVLGQLEMRGKNHEQVTMRQLIDRYTAKPFGWDQWAVVAVVAYLAGQSKVEIQLNGKVLARTEITGALRNPQSHMAMVVAPQRVFDPKTVNAFRKFVVAFTNDGGITKDSLELARVGKEHLVVKLTELKALRSATPFPFIDQLDMPIQMLAELCNHKPDWFITDFRDADDLLDAKDDVIDPIKAFLHGNQRGIFENALAFVQTNQSNIAFLPAGASDTVGFALEDTQIFRGKRTQQLGQAVHELEMQLQSLLEAERTAATARINDYWRQVPEGQAYAQASEGAQQSVRRQAEDVLDRVQHETQIPTIRNLASHFADTVYPAMLDELAATKPASVPVSAPNQQPSEDEVSAPSPVPAKQTMSIKKLALPGTGWVLETEDDIDGYLGKLRVLLIATINENKRITL